jgi:tetratricopeptide (TPR) repeat protein
MGGIRAELVAVQKKVMLYLGVGRFDAAEKLLKSTLAAHGSLANIHNLLGVTYHKQSRFADAIREFKKALVANNSFTEAALNLSVILCDVGQYDDAREVFEQAIRHVRPGQRVPDLVLGRIANHHVTAARAYEHSNMIQDAIGEYRKALGIYPNMADVRLDLGRLYLRNGQPDKAFQEFTEILNKSPAHAKALVWAGIARLKAGKEDEARYLWRQAQASSPGDPGARALVKSAMG